MNALRKFWNWYWVGKIKNGNTKTRFLFIILTLCAACCLCSFPASFLPSKTTPTPQINIQTAVSLETTRVASLVTPNTPTAVQPTAIPPTETPEPTATEAPTPAPIVINGSSTNVVDFDLSPMGGVAVAHISYSGPGNFIVHTLDVDNNETDLLVNTIGNYDGLVPVNFSANENSKRLKIESSGQWRVEFISLKTIKESRHVTKGQSVQLTSDDVIFIDSSPALATFTTNSDSNFIVHGIIPGAKRDLIVNEIGPYSGTAPIKRGTLMIVVKAEGPWQMDLK